MQGKHVYTDGWKMKIIEFGYEVRCYSCGKQCFGEDAMLFGDDNPDAVIRKYPRAICFACIDKASKMANKVLNLDGI